MCGETFQKTPGKSAQTGDCGVTRSAPCGTCVAGHGEDVVGCGRFVELRSLPLARDLKDGFSSPEGYRVCRWCHPGRVSGFLGLLSGVA